MRIFLFCFVLTSPSPRSLHTFSDFLLCNNPPPKNTHSLVDQRTWRLIPPGSVRFCPNAFVLSSQAWWQMVRRTRQKLFSQQEAASLFGPTRCRTSSKMLESQGHLIWLWGTSVHEYWCREAAATFRRFRSNNVLEWNLESKQLSGKPGIWLLESVSSVVAVLCHRAASIFHVSVQLPRTLS